MGGEQTGPTGRTNQPIVDWGTMGPFETPPPGPMCYLRREELRDELTPIARHMADEMNANAHSEDVRRMAELNRFSAEECITDYTRLPLWKQILGLGIQPKDCVDMAMTYHMAALLAWAAKVRQDGDWDHKPKIAARFHPRSPGAQHWHLYGNTLYYYDVWSNLHYGYVGIAAGFTESDLLDGAGMEQAASDLLRRKWPERAPGITGDRAYDDPHDRAAIEMGIALYRRKPDSVTAQDVLSLVIHSNAILTKPFGS